MVIGQLRARKLNTKGFQGIVKAMLEPAFERVFEWVSISLCFKVN